MGTCTNVYNCIRYTGINWISQAESTSAIDTGIRNNNNSKTTKVYCIDENETTWKTRGNAARRPQK